jgi:WhiB family redox-sensing transcriptional regulator
MPHMSYLASEWRESGACLTADPDLFFPVAVGAVGARQADEARRICAHCDVRRECLQFALDMGEGHGVWGGTTPDERRRAHRKQLAARRSATRRPTPVAPDTAA